MIFSKRQKRDIKVFKKLLPNPEHLIQKVHFRNQLILYHLSTFDFIIRLNSDILEILLADEVLIFPTLAFRELSSAKTDLLYYRIGQDF
jgi:hypothetical protein